MAAGPLPASVALVKCTVESKVTCKSLKELNDVIPYLSCSGRYVNVCFDIGGVLLKPNLEISHGTALHPTVFKRMMRSHAWLQYQEGKLTWSQTRRQLAQQLGHASNVSEADIQSFVEKARASVSPVAEIVQLVEALSSSQNKLKLYCLTNAAEEDYNFIVATFPDLFGRFEAVFYSGAVGIRKPNFGAFQHFLHETKCLPSETIFVDDTVQNVVAAEVLGFTTVLVEAESSAAKVVSLLVYHLRTEEERLSAARAFLHQTKGGPSLSYEGVRFHVHYDHFLTAELLDDPSFLPLHEAPETGIFNYFPQQERRQEKPLTLNAATHQSLPDDLDTTAIALSVLYRFAKVDMAVINTALNKFLECMNEDGLLPVYFDPLRPRIDHVVLVVACNLFHLAGRLEPIRRIEEILYKVLKSRAYLLGSLCYPSPETFLWHLARLAHGNLSDVHAGLEPEFEKLLAKRVRERVGLPGDALALAMRLLACEYCGISNSRDLKQLARMQKVDGSWELCPIYRYHDPKSWIGNEATTTAFAVAALQTRMGCPKAAAKSFGG